VVPYVWLVLLFAFFGAIFYQVRNTKRGYRYTFNIIAVTGLVLVVVFGTAFYAIGAGQVADDILSERFSPYEKMVKRPQQVWFNPEEGSLVGVIVASSTNSSIILRDRAGNKWEVDLTEADIVGAGIMPGQKIRLIGSVSSSQFYAQRIAPVHPDKLLQRMFRPDRDENNEVYDEHEEVERKKIDLRNTRQMAPRPAASSTQ